MLKIIIQCLPALVVIPALQWMPIWKQKNYGVSEQRMIRSERIRKLKHYAEDYSLSLFHASGSAVQKFSNFFFVVVVLLHDTIEPTVLCRPWTWTSTPQLTSLLVAILSFNATPEKLVLVDAFLNSHYLSAW